MLNLHYDQKKKKKAINQAKIGHRLSLFLLCLESGIHYNHHHRKAKVSHDAMAPKTSLVKPPMDVHVRTY